MSKLTSWAVAVRSTALNRFFSENDLQQIAPGLKVLSFKKNGLIQQSNQAVVYAYLLISGTASCISPGEVMIIKDFKTEAAPQWVNLDGVFSTNQKSSFKLKAFTDVSLVAIPVEEFASLVYHSRKFHLDVTAALADLSKEFQGLAYYMASTTAVARIHEFMRNNPSVVKPSQIARRVGCSRESVSRLLSTQKKNRAAPDTTSTSTPSQST